MIYKTVLADVHVRRFEVHLKIYLIVRFARMQVASGFRPSGQTRVLSAIQFASNNWT